MKRYLAILGMVTLLALPAVVSAETNDSKASIFQPLQHTWDAGRLAELLARKGVITQQELADVSGPVTTAPTYPSVAPTESMKTPEFLGAEYRGE